MRNKIKPLILYPVIGISVLIAIALSIYLSPGGEQQQVAVDPEPIPVEEVVVLDEYGLPQEDYIVQTGVVKSRQTLSHILAGFEFTPQTIDGIVKQVREVFDPRRVRAGNQYHGYYTNDSLNALQYLVYEVSPLDFIVLDFADSLKVLRGEKPVTSVEKTASGIIESSLWNVLIENDLSPELVLRLSEVLAWEVDFYRIQKGDRFKVIYQQDYVGDQPYGISKIDAVYFQHHGRDVYGFQFEHDTINGFYNPEGANLRKVFLKAPLEFGRISSRYSTSRMHPVLKHRRPHYGTDYAAPTGTPILAVGDGTITQTSYTSGNGNFVRIRHNSVYETQYLHMSRFAKGMKPGVRVMQGDVIGYVGATGLATGPHVCFRFWKNGKQVDHLREEFPSANPLPEDYYQVFFPLRDQLMEQLEAIDFPAPEELPV